MDEISHVPPRAETELSERTLGKSMPEPGKKIIYSQKKPLYCYFSSDISMLHICDRKGLICQI